MTENVVDIFTKEPIDRRKKASNQVRVVMDRMASYAEKHPQRSIMIVMIDDKGEYITDYIVQSEDFAAMCVVLGSVADEMSDLSLGIEDLED